MAISAFQCARHIKHSVGKLSAEVSALEVINVTGNLWASMYPWTALLRPPYPLNLTAAQNSIALPNSFGSSVGVAALASGIGPWRWKTYDALLRMMQNREPAPGGYCGVVITADQASAESPVGENRLLIYPTPPAAVTGAYSLFFRARFTEVHGETASTKINIPWYCDALFLALLRNVAEGWETPEARGGSFERLVAEVTQGEIFRIARDQDVSLQPSFGEMTGGALEIQVRTGPNSQFQPTRLE